MASNYKFQSPRNDLIRKFYAHHGWRIDHLGNLTKGIKSKTGTVLYQRVFFENRLELQARYNKKWYRSYGVDLEGLEKRINNGTLVTS
jgi:hypothetical protein